MPIVDMPVREMEHYLGTNPKPEDFDDYWEKAVCEMHAVNPELTLEHADFQIPGVTCDHLYFTGVGGAKIHVKYLRPAQISKPIPAVLLFHGYNVGSGDWMSYLSWVAAGCAVFAMDTRGQADGKSEDVGGVKGNTIHGHIMRGMDDENPHKLLYRDIFLDAAQLAGIAIGMEEIDETRVWIRGGSQAGGIGIACAALEPRVAKAALSYPFLSDYKRVWDMDLDLAAYENLRDYFRFADPRHEHETEIFTKLGYIDVRFLAERIQADMLLFTGLMDTVCPPSTQYAVYNRLTCKKKHVLYPDYGHEGLPGANDMAMDFFINNRFE